MAGVSFCSFRISAAGVAIKTRGCRHLPYCRQAKQMASHESQSGTIPRCDVEGHLPVCQALSGAAKTNVATALQAHRDLRGVPFRISQGCKIFVEDNSSAPFSRSKQRLGHPDPVLCWRIQPIMHCSSLLIEVLDQWTICTRQPGSLHLARGAEAFYDAEGRGSHASSTAAGQEQPHALITPTQLSMQAQQTTALAAVTANALPCWAGIARVCICLKGTQGG